MRWVTVEINGGITHGVGLDMLLLIRSGAIQRISGLVLPCTTATSSDRLAADTAVERASVHSSHLCWTGRRRLLPTVRFWSSHALLR